MSTTKFSGTIDGKGQQVHWEDVLEKPRLVECMTSDGGKLFVKYTDGTIEELPFSGCCCNGKKLLQVTEMDVKGPKDVMLPVTPSASYAFAPVEVLKRREEKEKAGVLCAFEAEDEEGFEENPFVAFDGTMYVKTAESFPSVLEEAFTEEGYLTVTTIDKKKLGELVEIEVI